MIEPSLSLSCAVNYPDEPRHSARQPQLAEVGDPLLRQVVVRWPLFT
jgi:hypothetical protein